MSWDRIRVSAMVAKLRMAGYKVLAFDTGFCAEVDGMQVFRAVDMGNERFDVKLNDRVVLDV
jgi:hypothetical protein